MTTLTEAQISSIEAEAKSKGVFKQYRRMVRKGESPRMALMLAVQQFPGINGTDTKFQKLERERVKEYSDLDMAKIHAIAKRAGISTAGKTYNGTLGKYTDPHAWISDTSDVKRAAKEKGLSLRGQVNVENPVAPPKPVKLAKRLVDETQRQYLQRDPGLAEKCKKNPRKLRELRETIKEKHGNKSRAF